MNKKEKLQTKLNKAVQITAVVCFVFIALYIISGAVLSPKLNYFHETAKVYDNEWVMTSDDGTEKTFKMPTSLELKAGQTVTLTTTLPDGVEDGMFLTIHTGKSFKAFIEGKEIYGFDNTLAKLPGRITKTVTVPIPLKEEYASKDLSLLVTNGKYERNIVNTSYIGTLMGITMILIKNYALQFVMAILLALTSIVTIVVFLYIEIRDNKRAPLIHLAGGILAICSWIIFDSPLFQLMLNEYFFDGPVGFMFVIMMGYPFMLYFDEISEKMHHVPFAVCEVVSVINFIVFTFLHVTNIMSFNRALVYLDLMLLVYIILITACMVRYYVLVKDSSHRSVVWGLAVFGFFGFLEIAITILNARMPLKVDVGGLFIMMGMIFLLVFAIRDQVKAFENLKLETQNAIAATKAKSDFLANMSHEIRTPINAIMGMNEMILRESTEENVKDYAKDVSSASKNLLDIINDILDFSKIESGKLEIINDNYDLGEVIYDVTTLVNMKAENKGLKLNISVDENLPSKLFGDDKRVREIITNILNNAVKYTERGYVNLIITGTVDDNEKTVPDKTVLLDISVEDSGQGIKPEDIDKIFTGFSQVNTKKNKNIEGTGLGLSITKRLIELMNGTIDVESEFGKGSTFRVKLPQKIVSDEKMGNYISHRHASNAEPVKIEQDADFTGVKILVVDDTSLNLKVISKLLAKTSAEITCAVSGEEMLELIKENKYDIILLDHMMPNMDGIEALKASRELSNNKSKDAPVIALTANAIVGAKEMYLEAGFTDYLSKPVKMDTMCEMMSKYIK